MTAGNWENLDGLNLQYGTQKAFTELGGDFLAYGDVREIELAIPLASLSTSATAYFPLSMNTQFPSGGNVIVETVQVVVDTPTTGSSNATLNVGLGFISSTVSSYNTFSSVAVAGSAGSTATVVYPQFTSITTTGFVSAMSCANLTTAGQITTMTAGSSFAGVYVGTSVASLTSDAYIIAAASTATFSSGTARVRIKYRGLGTISN